MLGFPPEDDDDVPGVRPPRARDRRRSQADERSAGFDRLDAYLDEQIADHRANPRDDLITYLLDVELFDEPLSDEPRPRLASRCC